MFTWNDGAVVYPRSSMFHVERFDGQRPWCANVVADDAFAPSPYGSMFHVERQVQAAGAFVRLTLRLLHIHVEPVGIRFLVPVSALVVVDTSR